MSARKARAMGLRVGDTIEGVQHNHTARLTLLWLGENVAVWREMELVNDGRWFDHGETADWELTCRTWTKVESAK